MFDYNKVLEENSILESNRLILRPFIYDDVDDAHLYTSDDLVTKYLNWPTLCVKLVVSRPKKIYISVKD